MAVSIPKDERGNYVIMLTDNREFMHMAHISPGIIGDYQFRTPYYPGVLVELLQLMDRHNELDCLLGQYRTKIEAIIEARVNSE